MPLCFNVLDYLPQSWRDNRLFSLLNNFTSVFFPLIIFLILLALAMVDWSSLYPSRRLLSTATITGPPPLHDWLLFLHGCVVAGQIYGRGQRRGMGFEDEDSVATLAEECDVSPLSSSVEAALPLLPQATTSSLARQGKKQRWSRKKRTHQL